MGPLIHWQHLPLNAPGAMLGTCTLVLEQPQLPLGAAITKAPFLRTASTNTGLVCSGHGKLSDTLGFESPLQLEVDV